MLPALVIQSYTFLSLTSASLRAKSELSNIFFQLHSASGLFTSYSVSAVRTAIYFLLACSVVLIAHICFTNIPLHDTSQKKWSFMISTLQLRNSGWTIQVSEKLRLIHPSSSQWVTFHIFKGQFPVVQIHLWMLKHFCKSHCEISHWTTKTKNEITVWEKSD